MACQIKGYETRSWKTDYTGEVVIHAAKRKMDPEGIKLLQKLSEGFVLPQPSDIPYGQIIAIATLVGCYEIGPSEVEGQISPRSVSVFDRMCGNWEMGRFAWQFEEMRRVEPVPSKGFQGLRDIDIDTLARLKEGGL
jgi:hypothetical protein